MSIYSNVTEQDCIILCKLAEQQENRRALKIKNRIFKQTQDIKLAESLPPITKKLDEVKETTQKLGEVIEKSPPENMLPQPAIEHTPHHEPLENNIGVKYDIELENTLKNIKNKSGFFKTKEDRERGWILNGYPIKILGRREVEITNN